MSVAVLPLGRPREISTRRDNRAVVVASASTATRVAIGEALRSLHWTVREASGAAEVFELLEQAPASAAILDDWLPDLEVEECRMELLTSFPALDILALRGGDVQGGGSRSPFRGELLHAIRSVERQEESRAECSEVSRATLNDFEPGSQEAGETGRQFGETVERRASRSSLARQTPEPHSHASAVSSAVPELLGDDASIHEVSRRIELVANRQTTVLIHGATGTGKELVARAIHRLSGRPQERFVAINCGAIPEHLVEAELFGYVRGAFTGATQNRIGRIEAAAGGTLFLDEVGELPLSMQCKLLRFLECGEIQRVGENVPVEVKVRIVAATHRQLGAMAREGTFRTDLLHRLSVFLIQTPSLAGRTEALDALIAHCLHGLAEQDGIPKQLSHAARRRLHLHGWPGNVRELQHTVERAWILSGVHRVIEEECIDFGDALL